MYRLLMRLVEMPWFYWTARAAFQIFVRIGYGLRVDGASRIPHEGGFVLAVNHVSAWDPPVVGSSVPREISFMAKKELFDPPAVRLLVRGLRAFPVDRARNDLSAVKEALRRLRHDRPIGIFLQGTRSADTTEAMDGAAFLATRAQVPLLPAAVWREGRRFRVRFGDPFPVAGSDRAALRRTTADAMRRIVDLMPEGVRPAAIAESAARAEAQPGPDRLDAVQDDASVREAEAVPARDDDPSCHDPTQRS
ncbi:MAG: lysophospholipid acyltransferase family protein [Trueperaceae bacterium]